MSVRTFTSALGGVLLLAAFAAAPSAQNIDASRQWGVWRGPNYNGVSTTANPPVEWGETKNIKWKVEIPGRGSSSPIVWGNRVYVTTAGPVGVTDASRTT